MGLFIVVVLLLLFLFLFFVLVFFFLLGCFLGVGGYCCGFWWFWGFFLTLFMFFVCFTKTKKILFDFIKSVLIINV